MLTGLDHLTIVVRDLAEASRAYANLGFDVVQGGRHPTGTHNALIALEDGSYLDLFGFVEPEQPSDHRFYGPMQRGGGLVDFCFRTDAFDADVEGLRAAGVEYLPARSMSRTRPDGFVLRWRVAFAPEPFRGVVPFLICDETPRAERVPASRPHSNGAQRVGALTLAVDDLERTMGWYRGLAEAQPIREPSLSAAGYRLAWSDFSLHIVAPTGPGPLREHLDRWGPSPYSAALESTHGARLLVAR